MQEHAGYNPKFSDECTIYLSFKIDSLSIFDYHPAEYANDHYSLVRVKISMNHAWLDSSDISNPTGVTYIHEQDLYFVKCEDAVSIESYDLTGSPDYFDFPLGKTTYSVYTASIVFALIDPLGLTRYAPEFFSPTDKAKFVENCIQS